MMTPLWKRYSLLSRIHTTKLKIGLAKILYRIIIPFVDKKRMIIVRNGIRYFIDLTEGIDLSLFLFGNFQKHILHSKLYSIPENAVIFDVGANFGVISLQLAEIAKHGHVYAFEPTHYAFKRLEKNVSLNPLLSRRITPIKSFISGHTQAKPKIDAFSSWKIDGSKKGTIQHPVHMGTPKSAKGVGAISLDDFCRREGITKLDFIKTDTDGHEHEVLRGARKTIFKYRPVVVFEAGDYLLKEKNIDFTYFLNYFAKLNYSLFDTQSSMQITRQNYRLLIPRYSTIDVIAIHKRANK